MKKVFYLLLFCSLTFLSFVVFKEKPVLYIIGDSTVKNGSGKGADALWGWGSLIGEYFDTTRLAIENRAIGGRSSRTFITEGRWDAILKTLNKGDYVIMQFGHNDAGPLDDTSRARGTIKGIGNESRDIYNPIRKVNETVYTYGHYMRRYIREARDKGAIPIVCSPVPRNNFKDGKAKRGDQDYALWAKQVAAAEGAWFIDLNTSIADAYDAMGSEAVARFFPKDHTHPNKEGSTLNAARVVQGIEALKSCDLQNYLK
ncbi:rhamnogalacturonan acetylesterase [Niabella yanshanensis]|uniref:Rhamnogalacturonan acetylesterase n=1 Tax=Niabella yanshanensis TaxID=577386 RepID=A0ABZ0W955_9BACT|nr:rhamnogalacturonan acetylesterase [Niabella yanshanensis]WQD38072.1 rhamnogalacturonan acetylesterase [Niabella yanshanensis]